MFPNAILKSPHNTARRGFTAIEFMFVVSVLGILAAVAISMFLNYNSKREEKKGGSEGRAGTRDLAGVLREAPKTACR